MQQKSRPTLFQQIATLHYFIFDEIFPLVINKVFSFFYFPFQISINSMQHHISDSKDHAPELEIYKVLYKSMVNI